MFHRVRRGFDQTATCVARASGRPIVFALAVLVVIIWAVTGPLFGYSDTWQLVINTGTTIVTFLMVFLIQNSQNRDSAAVQVKLDEVIRSGSSQKLYVGIEHLTEEEIEELRAKCENRAKKVKSAIVKSGSGARAKSSVNGTTRSTASHG